MKIPLKFSNSGDERLTLVARIMAPHVSGTIEFLVDTGSPSSFIGCIEAERLNIRTKSAKQIKSIYWGDKLLKFTSIRDVTLWTRAEDETGKDKLNVIHIPKLMVTPDFIHTDMSKESPTLLGLDFLIYHKLKLVVDGSTKAAWLENQ